MFTAAELAEHQADAESLMTLTLIPMKPLGMVPNGAGMDKPDWDPQDQHPGKAQGSSDSARDTGTRYVQIGKTKVPVLEGGLHIPIGAPVPTPSDVRGKGTEYKVAAVGPLDDPALLGRRYLVVEVPVKSYATSRRLNVVEVSDEA